jgi:peptidoglycan/LPS O-acetylase OafA/YrhL
MGLGKAQPGPTCWLQHDWLLRLGQVSYSVFLIHFPVCLLVNAAVTHFWPAQLAANAIGILLAFALSLLAGDALYRYMESPGARWRGVWKSPWATQQVSRFFIKVPCSPCSAGGHHA